MRGRTSRSVSLESIVAILALRTMRGGQPGCREIVDVDVAKTEPTGATPATTCACSGSCSSRRRRRTNPAARSHRGTADGDDPVSHGEQDRLVFLLDTVAREGDHAEDFAGALNRARQLIALLVQTYGNLNRFARARFGEGVTDWPLPLQASP